MCVKKSLSISGADTWEIKVVTWELSGRRVEEEEEEDCGLFAKGGGCSQDAPPLFAFSTLELPCWEGRGESGGRQWLRAAGGQQRAGRSLGDTVCVCVW